MNTATLTPTLETALLFERALWLQHTVSHAAALAGSAALSPIERERARADAAMYSARLAGITDVIAATGSVDLFNAYRASHA